MIIYYAKISAQEAEKKSITNSIIGGTIGGILLLLLSFRTFQMFRIAHMYREKRIQQIYINPAHNRKTSY